MERKTIGAFKQLTRTDRLKIEKLYNSGSTTQQIADVLRVNYTTIYRELKRPGAMYEHVLTNLTTTKRYSADRAQQHHDSCMKEKGRPIKLGHDYALADYIESKILNEDRSPAAIIMDMELEGKKFDTSVCEKTIYNWVNNDVFLNITAQKLPRHGQHKRTYKTIQPASRAPKGDSIEKRPDNVNDRSEPFHWEGDTVKGPARSKDCVFTLIERTSRRYIPRKMSACTMENVNKVLDDLEQEYGPEEFRRIFKSITVDNGSEFQDCIGMETSADGTSRTKIYYCHPYSSFEKGSNENHNGMFRRRFPKGTDFNEITQEQLDEASEWMNNYPRKLLGGTTPERIFNEMVAAAQRCS